MVRFKCHNSYFKFYAWIPYNLESKWVKKYIEMRNQLKYEVIAIGTWKLVLDPLDMLYLHDTFYVFSIFRNLISLSKLDLEGHIFNFGNQSFRLYKNSFLVGFKVLCNGLYKINLDIFRQKLEELVKDGVLKTLDFFYILISVLITLKESNI